MMRGIKWVIKLYATVVQNALCVCVCVCVKSKGTIEDCASLAITEEPLEVGI
jgi:hypothetical protein